MTVITQKSEIAERILRKFWSTELKNAQQASIKISLLEKFKSKDVTIIKYPSGVPLAMIKQVMKCIEESDLSYNDLNFCTLNVGHGKEIHFVKNETPKHGKYEERQKNTGGLNSEIINDIGDFRIAQIDSGIIMNAADFTLYCVAEDFVL